jgi:integrase
VPIYFDRARKRWRYEFDRYIDGRRQRTTKLLPKGWTRAQADAFAQEHDPRLFALATGAVKPRPLISQAVHLYLTQHAPGLKNFKSLERELANCMPAYEGRHIDELAEVAREYASAQAKTLAPATVKNRMSYLRAACRWAWKHHNLGDHDPAEKMTLPKVRNERHQYIDRAQLLRIARRITNIDARAVVLVLFYSGMRLGEALRAEPTKRGWLLADTKNGERRLIPIHRKVAYLARDWPREIADRTVQGCFSRAVQACGLTDLRVHDLRHSAASAMINAGVDLYTVGGVLGHKAAASTKRYSHLANETMAQAVALIGKR